ncbi:MAG: radical SAM family heme chaperone HemW [Archangium sp.]|nr:radical SAM family heme chaperone HemW [Archangium sp.]MDP3151577.1 radical SAM family heme chaperone HemW [Archangium sp.]MDP3569112.1 radical SAM family heme chaperone HemW [Archangium sp.]
MAPRAPVDEFTGLEAARFGVYVHFPYCLSKCPYCDFASTAAKQIPDERYTRAILTELSRRVEQQQLKGREVTSVFIGGGTPSLWAPRSVATVLEAIGAQLQVARDCEITLEANPGASDAERFSAYRAAGVNRLSMGVQSFEASTLSTLGRAHDGATAQRAFAAARTAGFDNVSMDFIYGVHGQTEAQVESDARKAVSLGSEHLSAYALTLDKASLAEEVPLARQLARGEVQLPPDDTVVAMQRVVRDVFAGSGLQRYEISNYAKPGFHSRHNALYWTGGEYLAVGTGATGYVKAEEPVRYSNQRSAEKYLVEVEAGRLPEANREVLTPLELFEERLAMGLRLVNGVDLEAVCKAFGQSSEARAVTVRHLLHAKLVERRDGRLALTDTGFDLHSAISARLM